MVCGVGAGGNARRHRAQGQCGHEQGNGSAGGEKQVSGPLDIHPPDDTGGNHRLREKRTGSVETRREADRDCAAVRITPRASGTA